MASGSFGQGFFDEVLNRAKYPIGEFRGEGTNLLAGPQFGSGAGAELRGVQWGGGGVDPLAGAPFRFPSATLGGFDQLPHLLQSWQSGIGRANQERTQLVEAQKTKSAQAVQPNLARQYQGNTNSDLLSRVPEAFRQDVLEAAQTFGVDPLLVAAMIRQESGGNPNAVSRMGASGLMQLMPDTARQLGVGDPFNPRENIFGGVKFISQLLQQYQGNVELALAAYNAGPGAVQNHGNRIPPYQETQTYVRNIMATYGELQQQRTRLQSQTNQYMDQLNRSVLQTGVSQFDLGLSKADAEAACGPAAVQWFTQAYGRNPSVMEAMNLAKEFGWNQAQGMSRGPNSVVGMLNRLGFDAYMVPYSGSGGVRDRIIQQLSEGRPVIIDTEGHYFQVTGYNQAAGTFTYGDAVGRRAGNVGTSLDGLANFGFGPPRYVIMARDNPLEQ